MSKIQFSTLTPFATPEESPGFLLWKVSTLWRRSIEASLKPIGLTHPQFVILATIAWLSKTEKQVSQVDIARQAGLDPNTTSQIIVGLERKKLIVRKATEDARQKVPMLTAAGTQLLKKAFPLVEDVNAKFFASINYKKAAFLPALKNLSSSQESK